jgi:hypothetical protein
MRKAGPRAVSQFLCCVLQAELHPFGFGTICLSSLCVPVASRQTNNNINVVRGCALFVKQLTIGTRSSFLCGQTWQFTFRVGRGQTLFFQSMPSCLPFYSCFVVQIERTARKIFKQALVRLYRSRMLDVLSRTLSSRYGRRAANSCRIALVAAHNSVPLTKIGFSLPPATGFVP